MRKDDITPRPNAALIQEEAWALYGRRLTRERAEEIASEVDRYNEAIRRIAEGQGLHDEPGSFLESLLRLRAQELG